MADREIVISRVIDAPRERVFEAFTEVRHLSRWWGPDGFRTTTRAFEFRVGGELEFVMHGPDGRDYQNDIVYVEVTRPERIVFDHVSTPKFRNTVTFAAEGEGAATGAEAAVPPAGAGVGAAAGSAAAGGAAAAGGTCCAAAAATGAGWRAATCGAASAAPWYGNHRRYARDAPA